MPQRLYRPEWFDSIAKGEPVSFTYSELPVEEMLILDDLALSYPGLRFFLRKQRGRRYLLTVLPVHNPTQERVSGEP